jgi:hypothetical protein
VRAKHTPLGLISSQSGSPPNFVVTEPSLTLRFLGSTHESPSIILSPSDVKIRSEGVTSQVSTGFCFASGPPDSAVSPLLRPQAQLLFSDIYLRGHIATCLPPTRDSCATDPNSSF